MPIPSMSIGFVIIAAVALPARAPRVLLVGAYERDNFGDLLFLLVTERYLEGADVVAAAPFSADMRHLLGREIPAYGRPGRRARSRRRRRGPSRRSRAPDAAQALPAGHAARPRHPLPRGPAAAGGPSQPRQRDTPATAA
jgi:hypothetical protein